MVGCGHIQKRNQHSHVAVVVLTMLQPQNLTRIKHFTILHRTKWE